jgi:hypothetical protein
MPAVQESLSKIIKQISASRSDGTFSEIFADLVNKLEELVEPALTIEKDAVRYLVSLMNLLLDVRRGVLPGPIFDILLLCISVSLDRPDIPSDVLLQGEEAEAEASPELRVGCTMMRWSDFCRYYAPRYGKSRSPAELEKLWGRIEKGDLCAPRLDLHLTSSSGVTWITDEEALYDQCGHSDGRTLNGTVAYDRLGLDWASGWSYAGSLAEARAVLIKAAVSQRRTSDRGLRVPNSVDAWGSLGFVPRRPLPPCKWPSNAGMTVDPLDGREYLPEAIHGLHVVTSNTDCPVLPCTPVQKLFSDRVDECGSFICANSVRALRSS